MSGQYTVTYHRMIYQELDRQNGLYLAASGFSEPTSAVLFTFCAREATY